MTDDPVLDLINQLVTAYDELAKAQQRSGTEAVEKMRTVTTLRETLHVTEAATPQGAAFLLREAAAFLMRSSVCFYGDNLRQIANRLSVGQRRFGDLIELRDIVEMLSGGPAGSPGAEAATLIENALKGAARPVVIVDTPKPRGRMKPCWANNALPPIP